MSAMNPFPLWKAAERTTVAMEPAPPSTPAFPFPEKSQSCIKALAVPLDVVIEMPS